MKVLYFGDVFAGPGREALDRALKKLIPEHQPDFVIVNGENLAGGRGITPELAMDLHENEVDVITTGNHVWDQRSIISFLEKTPWIIRPVNIPSPSLSPCPGSGVAIVESKRNPNAPKLAVVQAIGRVFMEDSDCPFLEVEKAVKKLEDQNIKCIFVDFHAEASSEKQAFAHFLDGDVSAVVGSHSHVQTSDERILPGATAAITDVGMTGCFDSVIGVKKEISIQRFVTKRPIKFQPAEGIGGYGAVVIEIDDTTGKAISILRLRENTV